MSDLPVTPPPRHPNDFAIEAQAAAGFREVQTKQKTRPLCGDVGEPIHRKRDEYTGR